MCEPNVSNFNPDVTYIVTWDDAGNEIVQCPINEEFNQDMWYDYANKKWANIITVGGGKTSYFVWIPRYVYKLGADQTADVKFVDKQNYWINPENPEEKIQYNDTTPTYDESGLQTNYVLPEGFNFNNQALSGYWVAKYELSTATSTVLSFNISKTDTTITIEKVTGASQSTYDFFLDGKKYTGSLPYTFENLDVNTTYKIVLAAKVNGATEMATRHITTLEKIPEEVIANPPSAPDVSNFNPECTFYVSYDSAGNETIGNNVSGTAPENWYDYTKKEWANIVTNNNNKIAYWVWIPRYEYKIFDTTKQEDYLSGDTIYQKTFVRFIDKNKTTPSDGFLIPEGFTFGGKSLSGYWVAKYELSS